MDPVAQITDLQWLDLHLDEDLVNVSDELPNPLVTPINRLLLAEHRQGQGVGLHHRVEKLEERLDVSPVVGVDGSPEGLDVLLRHRPLSIALWR